MNNIIHLPQETAAAMTTFNEYIKLYNSKDPKKFEEAIAKNEARYDALMDEVLGRK
jgi:hypothetical protein